LSFLVFLVLKFTMSEQQPKRGRGRPPKKPHEIFNHTRNLSTTNDADIEIIQQVIDIDERSNQFALDAQLAEQLANELNNSNAQVDVTTAGQNQPDDLEQILEQIQEMERKTQAPCVYERNDIYDDSHLSKIEKDRMLRQQQDREFQEMLALDRKKERERVDAIDKFIINSIGTAEDREAANSMFQYKSNLVDDEPKTINAESEKQKENSEQEPDPDPPVPQTREELRLARLKFFNTKTNT
jgi:hypothetical protein